LNRQKTRIQFTLQRHHYLFVALVLLPLFFAINIYVFLRPNALQLIGGIEFWHYPIGESHTPARQWLLFNAPDGLWAFSFESFLFLSFIKDKIWLRVVVLVLGIITMFLLEYLQKTLLPGTFDCADLVAILLGVTFSILFNIALNQKREQQ